MILTGATPHEAFAILSGNYDLLSYIGNDPTYGVHRHVVKTVDRPRDRVLLWAKLRLMVPCSIVTQWVPRSESIAMVLQHATLGHNMGIIAAQVHDVMPSDGSDASDDSDAQCAFSDALNMPFVSTDRHY